MNDAPSDKEAAADEQRARELAKEIRKLKQRRAAKANLAAQELQLRNLTVDDTRTSAPHTPVVDAYASASAAVSIEERISFAGALPDFGAVTAMFPSIPRRYLGDILHGRLDVKNIMRFTIDYSSMAASEKVDAPEARSFNDLMRGFEMYVYIVICFTLATSVKLDLLRVITAYRLRLMSIVGIKTFASIRLYHEEFLARVIRLGQDNPAYWTMPFQEVEWKLSDIPKKTFDVSSSTPSRKAYSVATAANNPVTPAVGERWSIHNGACRRTGDCNKADCKYRHMCVQCQMKDHNPLRCPSRR
jgi:hypothetical protein